MDRTKKVKSTKRKVPEVRQTKTSLYRTLLVQEKMQPKPKHFKKCGLTTQHVDPKKNESRRESCEIQVEFLEQPKSRRSLSAQHFDRKCIGINEIEEAISKFDMTQSMDGLNDLTALELTICDASKIIKFTTPKTRRSTCFQYFGKGIELQSTPASITTSLQEQLNGWLLRRGKPLSMYSHLKSFAVDNDMFEDPSRNQIDSHKVQNIVKDALEDLNSLILQIYSPENCEAWLGMIRLKYRSIEELHDYWQCKAAIERVRGNISSAVEFYKIAVLKGAELQSMEEFLDQLMEEFSILNVDITYESAEGAIKERQMKEVRNIFKSNILQSARQEKLIQSLQKEKSEEKFGNNLWKGTPKTHKSRLSLFEK